MNKKDFNKLKDGDSVRIIKNVDGAKYDKYVGDITSITEKLNSGVLLNHADEKDLYWGMEEIGFPSEAWNKQSTTGLIEFTPTSRSIELNPITGESIHPSRLISELTLDVDGEKKVIKTNHHKQYYLSILKAMEVSAKKNHDYSGGLSCDPLLNFKKAEDMGLTGFQGLWMRSLDKVGRINTFLKEGKLEVENEGVEDALMDLGNYCFLALALLKDKEIKTEIKNG